ncbi:chorismate synthase [Formivibrio citricus]|uniref:Chorismate synthase n=1 Tax=Formivibrio citricus TaxID=83765 RepID=A0A1I4W8U2_9NEIS|nr:chorismate synthase [Formivibrio citricus]SFN09793.1 chorismate synthase [Formivibrio citricus]
MSGNTFGLLFAVTSFGESHGPAIGCVVDGCPPGLEISAEDIQIELDRRKPGTSRHVTQRKEPDAVEILSGVFEGKTTGTPIALLIRNQDQRSHDYGKIVETFRPGHADYTYWHKYGIRDYRGGGRSSARETAVRVAAGAIAKKWLKEKFGIVIRGYMSQMGEIAIPFRSWDEVGQNAFFAPNQEIVPQLEVYLDQVRSERDSIGGKITVVAENVPVGWGEPVYDRLDAEIAYAMMGINAVKGVEIGDGFASIAQRGSLHCDELTPAGFASNHAGGILGGISSGQDIVVNLAVKPTPSIAKERHSIDKAGEPQLMATTGRHDPCVAIRATPIAEAMLALVLIDHALRHRAQCGDVAVATPKIPGRIL